MASYSANIADRVTTIGSPCACAAGSMRMNLLTSKASDAEIEKEIKDWLKFASELDGACKGAMTRSVNLSLLLLLNSFVTGLSWCCNLFLMFCVS